MKTLKNEFESMAEYAPVVERPVGQDVQAKLEALWGLVKEHGPRLSEHNFLTMAREELAVKTPIGEMIGFGGEFYRRWAFVKNFGFAVPTPEAIQRIKAFAAGGRVVDVGAGGAFWSYLLALNDVTVLPIDPNVDGLATLPSMAEDMAPLAQAQPWLHVQKMSAAEVNTEQVDVLMFIWPSMDDWPAQALRAFKGPKVIYVGEGSGGCTADNKFHHVLAKKFAHVETVEIPQWFGIHDRMYFFERRINESV